MKRSILVTLIALFAGACSKSDNPLSPSSSLGLRSSQLAGSGSLVVFSPTELGRVTITNNAHTPTKFLFIVWHARDTDHQTIAAFTSATVAAGATQDLTLGLTDKCEEVYQRDVYEGILAPSEADLQQFQPADFALPGQPVFYAPGQFWRTASCDHPAAPPEPPQVPPSPPTPPEPPTPPTTPSTPTCEQQNPPRFDLPPTIEVEEDEYSVRIETHNTGFWRLRILAGDVPYDPNPFAPDSVESDCFYTTACGKSNSLYSSYDWRNYSFKYWWAVLYRDGVEVYRTPVTIHAGR